MHSGHSVAEGNIPLFEHITEAADILFDGGLSGAYADTREELQRQLEAAEAAPGPASPEGVTGGEEADRPLQWEGQFGEPVHHLHKQPVRAAPAAADEPPVEGHASVPSAEVQDQEAKQTAVLGFAAAVDAEQERNELKPLAPPQARCMTWRQCRRNICG
jgi:hypothetical protein